jgi:hypothetical protein
MSARFPCLLLLVAPVTAVQIQTQPGKKYDIKIMEVVRKGDTVLVESSATTDNKVTILDRDGKKFGVPQPEGQSKHAYSYRETLLDDLKGDAKPGKLKRHYLKAEVTVNGKLAALPYQGKTVLIEKKGGKYRFQIEDGAELTGKDAELLDQEFNTGHKAAPGYEKVMLPKGAVAVGETWKMDTSALAKQWKTELGGAQVDESAVKATGKLLKAYRKDGRQFGIIRFELAIPLKAVANDGKQVKVTGSSRMTATIDMDVCIDGSALVGSVKGNTSAEIFFPHPEMPNLRVVVQSRSSMLTRHKLLAK